jgi:hypothetical protein
MKNSRKATLQTTLGDLIEALYSEVETCLRDESDTSVLVAFILNDLLTKADCRHRRRAQFRRRKKMTGNEATAH